MLSEMLETFGNLDALAEKHRGVETVTEIVNRVLTGECKLQQVSWHFVNRDEEIELRARELLRK